VTLHRAQCLLAQAQGVELVCKEKKITHTVPGAAPLALKVPQSQAL